jgi:hypothetical protein
VAGASGAPAEQRPGIERPGIVRTGFAVYWVPRPIAEVEAEVAEQVLRLPGWKKGGRGWGTTYLRGPRPGTAYGPTVRLMKGRLQNNWKELDFPSAQGWTTIMVGDHLREPTLSDRLRIAVRRYLKL